MGFWDCYDTIFTCIRLLRGSGKTRYGHPPSHHFKVCSPWNRSAHGWLGLPPADGPKNVLFKFSVLNLFKEAWIFKKTSGLTQATYIIPLRTRKDVEWHKSGLWTTRELWTSAPFPLFETLQEISQKGQSDGQNILTQQSQAYSTSSPKTPS